ncbi:MAG: hypothetical protein JSR60_18300 [Proteobacteria bacterium]|nr:hypothetical protein [Pseudomonadota bacterium]
MSLAALGLETPDKLRAAFASRRTVPIHGGAQVSELLPWDAIDSLKCSDAIDASDYYLGFRGGAVPREAYREPGGKLKPAVIQAFLDKGASLVLNQIHRHVPAIGQVSKYLAGLTGSRVIANAYLTFGEVSIFAPHSDGHDVLALQIFGAKRWIFYDTVGQVRSEILLESSDLLFVPQGEIHEAIPVALPSVHLSFGLAYSQAGS